MGKRTWTQEEIDTLINDYKNDVLVRDISKTIDLNAANASNSFTKLFAAAGIKTPQGQLQQEVHITAEFPNVSDKNEILEAFDNVINLAAQYSGRK